MMVPAGVKMHLALGYTDMRKGLDGLAMLVQDELKKNMAHEEAVKRRIGHHQAGFGQCGTQLIERNVLACFPQGENVRAARLDPTRTHVAALGFGCEATALAPPRLPADCRRWRHAEPSGRSPATHSVVDRSHKQRPQIHGKRLTHACWPPYPASRKNQICSREGTPSDS